MVGALDPGACLGHICTQSPSSRLSLGHACVCVLSRIQFFATPWTVALQAPLSVGLPRQEYWSRLPFPSPNRLPNPETELMSPAIAGGFFTTEPLVKHQSMMLYRVATSSSLPEEGSLGLPRKAIPPRSKSTQGLGDPTYPGGVPSLPSPPEDLHEDSSHKVREALAIIKWPFPVHPSNLWASFPYMLTASSWDCCQNHRDNNYFTELFRESN